MSPLAATLPTTPLTPFTAVKSPNSPHPLQRSQPKPSPIQTSPQQGGTPQRTRTTHEDDDRVSQLARDLESAMNPTPTEPVPQPYFLQGKGLLERIPSQVSMDDGLLDDHQDFEGQFSEESDGNEGDNLNGAQGLSKANSSLRRQRSGGKRRFRITRSRSRNRSKGRVEGNKPALMPIEVGYPSVLTSSDWPFDKSPPSQTLLDPLSGVASGNGHRSHRSPPVTPGLESQPGTSTSSATRLLSQINGQQQYHHQQQVQKHQYHVQQLQQQQYQQIHSRQTSTASMQSSKFRAGPHLPFADSVTIGNPIRVGRGIGSFTVYSITLTLCDPAVASTALETLRANRQVGNLSLGSSVVGMGREDSHLTGAAGSASGQVSSSSWSSLSTSHAAGGLAPPRTRASLAAQVMTRSLSFPELGHSAERLLMDIQPTEDVPRAPGTTSHKQYHSEGGHQHQQRHLSQATIVASPPRVIHVRKRYSDFVTLRAHLVETFKDKKRLSIFSGRSKNSRNLSTAATPSRRVHAQNSQPITSDEYDEEEEDGNGDDDEESNEGYLNVGSSPSHSRRHNSNSMSNDSSSDHWIATDSIIRGLPKLPPKRVVGKFRPAFVEKRRRELEYFLEWVVAHPVIGDCPVVVQWFLGESH
ncbi:hypothetical protein BG003_006719 [Podila horticola]|nr:hypothetical protein BG003_006719 [Podila horticola]